MFVCIVDLAMFVCHRLMPFLNIFYFCLQGQQSDTDNVRLAIADVDEDDLRYTFDDLKAGFDYRFTVCKSGMRI